jgi:competence protein ComEC
VKRVVLIVAAWMAASRPAEAELFVHILPVGYGEAILVQEQTAAQPVWTALLDAGPRSGADALVQKLRSLSTPQVDDAFLTNPHPDHFEGFKEVSDHWAIGRFYWNGSTPEAGFPEILRQMQDRGTFVLVVDAATAPWIRGHVLIEIVHPSQIRGAIHDDNLVVLLTYGKCAMLFTGDLSDRVQEEVWKEVQKRLAERKTTLQFASWPHHGDRLAPAWEQAMEHVPYLAVSVGPNSYGLPRMDASPRLWPRAKRTDLEGALSFVTDGITLRQLGGRMRRSFP